ncbi:hypothetical protein ABPG72_022791 [Tetrahymena utriculariae]
MRQLLLAFAIVVISVGTVACFKQNHSTLVGGYSTVNLNNPPSGFIKAREYALSHFLTECQNDAINSDVKLGETLQGFSQIVAGTNYKIVFQVENYSADHLTIVVFQSLPDQNRKVNYSISSCQ